MKKKLFLATQLAVIFLVILAITSVLSGAVMLLFGFKYANVLTFAIFFLWMAVVDFPLGMLVKYLLRLSDAHLKLSPKQTHALKFCLITAENMVAMAIVAAFMAGIVLPVLAMFIGAVFLAALDELVDYLTNK